MSWRSPLGVAHWKIEIPYFRGALPQTVVSWMSPLGVADWKSKQVPKIKCPNPPAGGQENSFAPQMIFLRPGGWANKSCDQELYKKRHKLTNVALSMYIVGEMTNILLLIHVVNSNNRLILVFTQRHNGRIQHFNLSAPSPSRTNI